MFSLHAGIYKALASLWLTLWPLSPQAQLPLIGTGSFIAAGPVPALQQQATNSATTATLTITFASAPSNGDVIICQAGSSTSNTINITSISSTNTTWTMDGQANMTSVRLEIWHGIVSGGSGGTAVAISYIGSTAALGNCSDWANVNTSSPLDGSVVTNTGTANSATTGAYSAGLSGDLVIGGVVNTGGLSTNPGAPYTALNSVSLSRYAYHAGAPSGSQTTASWTTLSTHRWATIIAGYAHS